MRNHCRMWWTSSLSQLLKESLAAWITCCLTSCFHRAACGASSVSCLTHGPLSPAAGRVSSLPPQWVHFSSASLIPAPPPRRLCLLSCGKSPGSRPGCLGLLSDSHLEMPVVPMLGLCWHPSLCGCCQVCTLWPGHRGGVNLVPSFLDCSQGAFPPSVPCSPCKDVSRGQFPAIRRLHACWHMDT